VFVIFSTLLVLVDLMWCEYDYKYSVWLD